jgi:hypothetical protein
MDKGVKGTLNHGSLRGRADQGLGNLGTAVRFRQAQRLAVVVWCGVVCNGMWYSGMVVLRYIVTIKCYGALVSYSIHPIVLYYIIP